MLTRFLGVPIMYLLLFTVTLLVAVAVVTHDYMDSVLGRAVRVL